MHFLHSGRAREVRVWSESLFEVSELSRARCESHCTAHAIGQSNNSSDWSVRHMTVASKANGSVRSTTHTHLKI